MLKMERTGVVFFKIQKDGIYKFDEITSLQVFNGDKVSVTINGMTIAPSESKILIISDSTYSNFEMNVQFELGRTVSTLLDVIYKKIIKCST